MIPVPWYRLAGPRTAARPETRRTRSAALAAARVVAACWAAGLPALAVAQTCAPPPVVPPALLRNGAPFAPFQQFVDGLSFVGSVTKDVIPCNAREAPSCRTMRGTVSAESRANCVDTATVQQDSARVVGMVKRDAGWNPANLGFGPQNTSGVVYLLVQGGKSLAVANWSGRVHTLPQSNGTWSFRFHHEDHSFPDSHALWRPDSSATTGLVAMHARPAEWHGGPSALVDDADGMQLSSPEYVWMTCAAGCCQFHGSPPDGNPGPHPPHGGHGGHGGHGNNNPGPPHPERRE